MTCCFFGHSNTTGNILPELEYTIKELIDAGVDTFYVGNQGNFDKYAYKILKKLKEKYIHIKYNIVLAYMPIEKTEGINYENTIYPDGLENVPKKFAIWHRNKWMVKNSEIVVAYIKYSCGGAAHFAEYAKRQGRKVINIANLDKK